MTEYKSNSNRAKEKLNNGSSRTEKKVEKVVTGPVVTKKKSAFSKFADEFISEDAKNVKSYVVGEVLIPAIKKAISDIITDGIDMILYGGSRRSGGKRSQADRVSYRNYYDRDGRSSRDYRPMANSRYSTDDIILSSRAEAEEVLLRGMEICESLVKETGAITVLQNVALIYRLVAEMCKMNYGPEHTEYYYLKAIDILNQLTLLNPDNHQYENQINAIKKETETN